MRPEAKMKLKIIDNILNVKFRIEHEMITQKIAEKKRLEIDYITHIIIRSGSRILFTFQSSMFISKNPIFKFKVKQKELKLNDVVEITWTTYLGKTESYSKKIERIK